MRRTFVVVVAMTVGAVLAASAPALAKGEGQPVGAIITGPGLPGGGSGGPGGGGSNGSGGSGMGGPGAAMGTVHVRGADPMTPLETTPFWRLASLTGALIPCWGCGHYYDSPAPKDVGVLGPVYHVTYFAGECCARAVHQSIYPFAPGGPWTFTQASNNGVFMVEEANHGWFHAHGTMAQDLMRFLHHLGVPKQDPVAAAAGASASTAGSSTAWRIPVALVALIALLVLGAAIARPKRAGKLA
ncbi:MAG TPA: hypothetical protein VGB19_03565 [Actinomycetota bacterium]